MFYAQTKPKFVKNEIRYRTYVEQFVSRTNKG